MVVDHPLFGGIGGLVARDVIEEDEEIFVDYRYDPQSSPQWYKDITRDTSMCLTFFAFMYITSITRDF